MIPKVIIGIASCEISSFNPNSATSQPVKVVPIFEPNTIPIPAFKEINPALINEITRTEIRELEFKIAVDTIPTLILLIRLSVDFLRILRKGPSVKILNPFSRLRIPNNITVTPTLIFMSDGYTKRTIISATQKSRKIM